MRASWFSRRWLTHLVDAISERTRGPGLQAVQVAPGTDARALVATLLSQHGEAAGTRVASLLADRYRSMDETQAREFFLHLSDALVPPEPRVRKAAAAYLASPNPATAADLADAVEPPRQELLRRLNMARDGTALLVAMRSRVLDLQRQLPALAPLASDLKHLLSSWFNRGFLQIERIDWQSPAAILEKLIRYEAVHAIHGWDDLRRRLERDRRCFAFFHPALRDEPLIFVEVALTDELSSSVAPLLAKDGPPTMTGMPTTAIFYGISNCQPGLRGIAFGNFLLKQVVADLVAELPSLTCFATLSPIPRFRAWLDAALAKSGSPLLPPGIPAALASAVGSSDPATALRLALARDRWWEDPVLAEALRKPMTLLCARYLVGTQPDGTVGRATDPVARFHLANGARMERINWLADISKKGIEDSYGLMVNYRYVPDQIEANHEAFVARNIVVQSEDVVRLLGKVDAKNQAQQKRPTAA